MSYLAKLVMLARPISKQNHLPQGRRPEGPTKIMDPNPIFLSLRAQPEEMLEGLNLATKRAIWSGNVHVSKMGP